MDSCIMKTLKPVPISIPYQLNRSSPEVISRLEQTCDHFNITDRSFFSEILLRLGQQISTLDVFPLPKDEKSKQLFRIYKYFDSLSYANN